MKVTENDQIVCIDVDDTLVVWSDHYMAPHDNAIPIVDPYDNSTNYLVPHKKHIALLKKYKGRGNFIRVWSAAGYRWAEAVVFSLGLENYVDSVETKPTKIVDDLPVNEIFPVRIYMKDSE